MNLSTNIFNPVELSASKYSFIRSTYTILLQSIAVFIAFEWFLFKSGLAESLAKVVFGGSWLLILGGFMILSWFASKTVSQSLSPEKQWAALMAFVAGEAIILSPMLYLVYSLQGSQILITACVVTIAIFSVLTFSVFQSKKDFSFLRQAIVWGSMSAGILILFSILFGLNLGTFFIVAMIGLSGMMILYDTSNILHAFPEDRPVAAALQLFSSLAMLFWYILQFFMSQRD